MDIENIKYRHCFNCGRQLDSSTAKNHPYSCTNCDCLICEVCHYERTKHRKNPKENESNCIGCECPNCEKTIHFNEI